MRNLGIWKCSCGQEYILAQNSTKLIMYQFNPIALAQLDDIIESVDTPNSNAILDMISPKRKHQIRYDYSFLAKEYVSDNKKSPISPRQWWLSKFDVKNIQDSTAKKFRKAINDLSNTTT